MDNIRHGSQADTSCADAFPEQSHDELMSEVKLFETQEHLKNEARQRREAFDTLMQRRRAQFERSEQERRISMANTLVQICETHGIAETRKRFVPAYTFTRFSLLPMEVQLRIWSMAARIRIPRIFSIVKRRDDEDYIKTCGSYRGYNPGSSRIRNTYTRSENTSGLAVLKVCRTSRTVALKVYTLLQSKLHAFRPTSESAAYYATLYDKFYMGGRWHHHKVLVDMMIQRNTTRPLMQRVQADLDRLQNIKHFIVDLRIFADLPVELWAEFRNLESLTISIYPENVAEDTLKFVKPRRGTKLGKRAEWVYRKAYLSFQEVKISQNPNWQIPKVEVVAQYSNTDADWDIEEDESCHRNADMTTADQSSEHSSNLGEDREITSIEEDTVRNSMDEDHPQQDDQENMTEGDDPEDDSRWYRATEARITQTIPPERLRKFKHRYHPSRRVEFVDWIDRKAAGKKREWGGWWTDSEAEFLDERHYYPGHDTDTDPELDND